MTTASTTQTTMAKTPQLTDEQILAQAHSNQPGALEIPMTLNENTNTTQTQQTNQTQQTTTPPPMKYELNGKTFDSPEEMSEYVAGLELMASKSNQPATPPSHVPPKKKYEDVLYEDPDKFVSLIKEELRAEESLIKVQEAKKQAFWKDFYGQNPDLKGREKLVDALVEKNRPQWSTLPDPKLAKVIADESRSTLKELGVNLGTVTEVSRTNPATLSSSPGEAAPRTTQVQEPKNFAEQIRALRRKKA